MKKKRVVNAIICVVLVCVLFGVAYMTYPKSNIEVQQSDSELVIKVNSKEDQKKVQSLFSDIVFIVWSEFNELPDEDSYDSISTYEGMSYGVSHFGESGDDILTVITYYDGVYTENDYLNYTYSDGVLKVSFIDSENSFNNTNIADTLVNYLYSEGIKQELN